MSWFCLSEIPLRYFIDHAMHTFKRLLDFDKVQPQTGHFIIWIGDYNSNMCPQHNTTEFEVLSIHKKKPNCYSIYKNISSKASQNGWRLRRRVHLGICFDVLTQIVQTGVQIWTLVWAPNVEHSCSERWIVFRAEPGSCRILYTAASESKTPFSRLRAGRIFVSLGALVWELRPASGCDSAAEVRAFELGHGFVVVEAARRGDQMGLCSCAQRCAAELPNFLCPGSSLSC